MQALENMPELLPGLYFYLLAYTEISHDRQMGMAPGPVPWSSVIKYCHLYGIHDIDDIDVFMRHIRKLDQFEISYREQKKPKKK